MKNLIQASLSPDEYLRLLRSRLGMTQAQLAQQLGITRQAVNYYEKGIFKVPADRLEAVKRMAEEGS